MTEGSTIGTLMLQINTMPKKLLLLISFTLLLGVVSFCLWRTDKASAPVITPEPATEGVSKTPQTSDQPTSEFVVNVDPDVSHWQMKETKHMVFKFPKEWYWIEATPPSPEYGRSSIITNNPNHLLQYPDIGMFDDVTNKTEVVITDHGTATSNSGTPIDSLKYLTDMAHEADSTAECTQLSDAKNIPIIASCLIKRDNHQVEHNYYVIDEINSIIITARTTNNTLVPRDILEKIARNIKIKY